jgi:secondary thiamine-phosphate synthase enzyme
VSPYRRVRRIAVSPCRRVAVSPYRRVAVSPYRRIAVSPYRRIAVSPYRRIAVSPCRRIAVSPYRRVAVSPYRPCATRASCAIELVSNHPMKSYRKELWFETKKRRELIRITPQINQCLRESGIQEGLILINAMHITASVFINDNESGLHHDFEVWLERLAPERPYDQYAHNGAEDNADAHLKRTIMGREVVVAVTQGKLDFGPWEEIFYGEFDGKRRKRVLVKIIGK